MAITTSFILAAVCGVAGALALYYLLEDKPHKKYDQNLE